MIGHSLFIRAMVVQVESAQFRTSTQWKNKKSPFWDEGFELYDYDDLLLSEAYIVEQPDQFHRLLV